MTVFKIFIVAAALLLCPSLGTGYNCTRRYQRLQREVAVVKVQCPNAFHDCCQVGVCVRKSIMCYSKIPKVNRSMAYCLLVLCLSF